MADVPTGPDTCTHEGCSGVRVAVDKCLAHLEESQLAGVLSRMERDHTIDARGVRLDGALLERVLAAVRDGGRPVLRQAQFDGAVFEDPVWFNDARFEGAASFRAASFADAWFERATFDGEASFDVATFRGTAAFNGARFKGTTSFGGESGLQGATFMGAAWFRGAKFERDADAWFSGAAFEHSADFEQATFEGQASFADADFKRSPSLKDSTVTAGFIGARFDGVARFWKATLRRASFSGAAFNGGAEFGSATFEESPEFNGAQFTGDAWCGNATFEQGAQFEETSFQGLAGFGGSSFLGPAGFDGTTFADDAWFDSTTFKSRAGFSKATFEKDARFKRSTLAAADFEKTDFRGDADFPEVAFEQDAHFDGATFGGNAVFRMAVFTRDAHFDGATFERARELGPAHVFDRLWLDRAVFAEAVRLEVSALRASFARAVFRGGADMRLRWAEVWLEDAEFAGPSLLAGLQARLTPDGEKGLLGWEWPVRDGTWRCSVLDPPKGFAPRVLSIRAARVAQLSLSGADLEPCRFAGAHGVDELRLERVDFARPPKRWRWIRWRLARWTRRRTIAEEHAWRTRERHGSGWELSASKLPRSRSDPPSPPWPPEDPDTLEAEQTAGIYRALRKGREDGNDTPGAGDFYYGEMEMRRHSAPFGERSILWLYWLFSGYGLRATRALLALALTITLGAVCLHEFGFEADRSPEDGTFLFSLESSISLLRAPEGDLTPGGHVIQIVLRLTGPLFFALALLALRGRVKR